MELHPKVGVGPFILRDGKILLGKRKGSHGAGEWSVPGGHLEEFETVEACCRREIKEETGLTDLDFIKRLGYSENFFPVEKKHYITVYAIFVLRSGEPRLIEPNKCEGWEWFDLNALPKPMFGGLLTQLSEVGDIARTTRTWNYQKYLDITANQFTGDK